MLTRAWWAKRIRLGSEIAVTYVRARWRLRRSDLPSTLAWLRARARSAPVADESHREAVRLARAAYRTLAVLPADSRCLLRSLVVTGLLERRGIPAKVVLAARTAGGFDAHAWVEVDGRALLDEAGAPYERLTEL